ncbi:MAG: ATP-binding protein [Bacteroidota bacterium]|nr:ATP-binding protein [Bacteroidota bacterium]
MYLLQINTEMRVIIGISAMVLLFTSFLISFITSQRKKLQYHKEMQQLNERQQNALKQQNELLEKRVKERTAELSDQKEALQASLTDLKATQLQLIQKEKMASLGELTAGIAHEIQNPLNFVNNFSELNNELINEMKEHLDNETLSETGKQNITLLINSLTENLEKIQHHGKRADDIVKGMLQHSRSTGGEKELVDINAIALEYLRLSYHGLRAKDKSFNATMKTDFDETINKINIIPQETGRVLLNLYNNAFYAVTEKKELNIPGYEPTVSVATKKLPGKVEIRVRDNGLGISEKVMDKIFMPFFTTKPSGKGTGLGLSLSFDIISKGHGGEMKVDTKEGEYTEFIITLPTKQN